MHSPSAGPKKCIAEFLINKQLAFLGQEQTRLHVVPYLLPLPEEIWSPSDDTIFTAFRHLVLEMAPSRLHATFSSLISKAIQTYPNVSIGKKSLVIHGDRYSCRVDCGSCLVNRSSSDHSDWSLGLVY